MKKNNTKNNPFPTGLIIILILGIIGVIIINSTWNYEFTLEGIKEYIWYHGIEFFISLLFIISTIVSIYKYIINYMLPPIEDIMYLKEISYNTMYLVDKKGKKISYFEKNTQYKVGKCYKVLRTADEIKEVREETNDTFTNMKEKEAYWLNIYTPFGNIEDFIILPIVYVFLIIGILSTILLYPELKAYGLAITIIPAFIIIYDYIYKCIKKSLKNYISEEEQKEKMKKIEKVGKKAYSIIKDFVLLAIIIFTYILLSQPETKNILSDNIVLVRFIKIFITVQFFVLIPTILSKLSKNKKLIDFMKRLSSASYLIAVLIFVIWFMHLGIKSLIETKDYEIILLFAFICNMGNITLVYFIISILKKKQ